MRPEIGEVWEDYKGSKAVNLRVTQVSVKARKKGVPLKRLRAQENMPSGAAIPKGTRKG